MEVENSRVQCEDPIMVAEVSTIMVDGDPVVIHEDQGVMTNGEKLKVKI